MIKRIFGKYDFEFHEDGSVILNEDGFRKFCAEYERWMNGKNVIAGENSYRAVIRNQIAKLKKTIMQGEDSKPYCMSENNVCD